MKRISNRKELHTRRTDLRVNQTVQEGLLWQHLKDKKLGIKFRRQHSVGPYILDFYSTEIKLAIELDGSQHLENQDYDNERSNYLREKEKVTILRFWNNEINTNIEGVVMKITETIKNLLD
jgi:very-short-patch-repair endonuclease